jgi:elongator complex protein 3
MSLYDACNTFDQYYAQAQTAEGNYDTAIWKKSESDYNFSTTLQEAQSKNESCSHRIIGLTVETRPEYVTDENCQLWREMGITRLEMGIQSLFDDVLDANKRGHSVQQCREAIHRLRQYGFKISTHFMA